MERTKEAKAAYEREYYKMHSEDRTRRETAARRRYAEEPKLARAKNAAWRKKQGLKLGLTAQEVAAEYTFNSQLRRAYGLTRDQYDALVMAQCGACAICGLVTESRLCVDHDHETDEVRGLLCRKCNTTLGLVKDSISTLNNAVAYLELAA